MRNLLKISLAATAALATLAVSGTAMARRGADDAVGHVRGG